MKLFDPNGALMGALGKLSDVVLCNILFCLACLPVVTIGAAATALYSVMQDLIADKLDEMVLRAFWNAFRRNFGQATVLWLLCLAVFVFLFFFYQVILLLGGTLGRVYRISFYVLVIVFLTGFLYLFPLQARFQNQLRFTLRNAWLTALLAFPRTLLILLVDGAVLYVSFFMNPQAFQTAIFLWCAAGFGVVALLNSYLFRPVFAKISPRLYDPIPDEGRATGAVFTDEAHRDQDLMPLDSSYSDPDWNRTGGPGKPPH